MIHSGPMKVETRRRGEIPVLSPAGRVTIGAPAAALKQALEEAAAGGASHIIVDGSRVEYMDSSGIGELIATARELAGRGGRVGIASPSAKFREILEITKLQTLFVVGDDEQSVAAKLLSSRP
jgi:anti-sigma B factor antagonist